MGDSASHAEKTALLSQEVCARTSCMIQEFLAVVGHHKRHYSYRLMQHVFFMGFQEEERHACMHMTELAVGKPAEKRQVTTHSPGQCGSGAGICLPVWRRGSVHELCEQADATGAVPPCRIINQTPLYRRNILVHSAGLSRPGQNCTGEVDPPAQVFGLANTLLFFQMTAVVLTVMSLRVGAPLITRLAAMYQCQLCRSRQKLHLQCKFQLPMNGVFQNTGKGPKY